MFIQDQDYNLKGYYKTMTPSSLGDAHLIEYYADYNNGSPTGLKVRETRTYTRNAITGIIETITVFIEWIGSDGVSAKTTKTLVKHLDVGRGMEKNEKARKRLLNQAKGAAIQLIGLEAGKTFMRNFGSEMNLYIEGDRQPLVDGINNSVETQLFKDTLVNILDIAY